MLNLLRELVVLVTEVTAPGFGELSPDATLLSATAPVLLTCWVPSAHTEWKFGSACFGGTLRSGQRFGGLTGSGKQENREP